MSDTIGVICNAIARMRIIMLRIVVVIPIVIILHIIDVWLAVDCACKHCTTTRAIKLAFDVSNHCDGGKFLRL